MSESESNDAPPELAELDIVGDAEVSPSKLHTDGDNPNEQDDATFGRLLDGLDSGWVGGPIIVNQGALPGYDGDGDGLICDGEHRWRAAQEVGRDTLPVKWVNFADDGQRRYWRQHLNKVTGEHDSKRDALEYDQLLQSGYTEAVEALTEAADEDLNELLAQLRTDDSRAPGYEYDPDHDIQFEDCVAGMAERLADDSVDCVVTDPPYGMDFHGDATEGGGGRGSKWADRVKEWDGLEGDETLEDALDLLRDTLAEIERVLRDGGHAYIFCDWRGIERIKPLVERSLTVKNLLVWDKGSMGIGDLKNNWGYSHEFILFATNGDRASELTDATRNVLEHGRPARTDYVHPTQKPLPLISELVQTATSPGEVVLDPFMGSGTTAVAAIQTDREYVGFETDAENYRDVIERRVGEAKRQRGAGVNSEDPDLAKKKNGAGGPGA